MSTLPAYMGHVQARGGQMDRQRAALVLLRGRRGMRLDELLGQRGRRPEHDGRVER